MAEPILSREAKYRERMIEVRVRFWTNDIAQEIDEILNEARSFYRQKGLMQTYQKNDESMTPYYIVLAPVE